MNFVEKLEPIRVLEKQSGLSRLLIFLLLNGDCNISYMIDASNINPNVAYTSVRKATDLHLITSDYDGGSFQRIRMLKLTDKGRKIAGHLSVINDILAH
ncbi:MAG: hypothetical protein KIS30_09325 [Thermoplasmata archaeon]|nr:hypothetical protein [Candidatus Sysuiplasma acidicola]MBX8646939.1 hypothetical protein [Candidatus Sysuiplasma acidicola]